MNVLFAVAVVCWGLARTLTNLDTLLGTSLFEYGAVFFLPSAGALVLLVTTFPRPLDPDERPLLGFALLVGFAPLAFATLVGLRVDPLDGTTWTYAFTAGFHRAAIYTVLVLLALRFDRVVREDRRELAPLLALMSAALLMDPGARMGVELAGVAVAEIVARNGFTSILPEVVVCALWLRNAARTRRPDSRHARNVALLAAGLPLVGALFGVMLADPFTGPFGVARIVTVLLLAYAILRHQLLGIDVKVRFAISKSTVAAVFIAVFFVASELAQEFFAGQAGSRYVGVVAAGALVFALAPLQRAADHLAERAIPVAAAVPADAAAPPVPGTRDARRREVYAAAVRAALADHTLTREEERMLAHLAEELGLGAGEAADIRHACEDEKRAR
ncbi:MAG TPA: hypothetical protein VI997_07005 [Candidatus Thermoplasmatota archaeon]|nr:hypothetical protein [Candidatus Thermoplasmatota archaeon]